MGLCAWLILAVLLIVTAVRFVGFTVVIIVIGDFKFAFYAILLLFQYVAIAIVWNLAILVILITFHFSWYCCW